MATQLNVRPLTTQEQAASGYTHEAVIDAGAGDLTVAVNNTAQTFNLCLTTAGDVIEKAHLHFAQPFKNTADPAFNSTTFDFGDAGSATRWFSGVQGNANGTAVPDSYENTAYGPYTAAVQLTATVHSMSGKKLSDLNVGKAIILFKLNRAATDLEAGAH